MGSTADKPALLQGTLDLLILKTLCAGKMHGYDISERILDQSEDLLRVEEGALYPALHRLELRGLVASEWGVSANNRRARYYTISAAGRNHLEREANTWKRMSFAVLRVLEA
jgi:PadR family transcriptional regulator, regulatory protein PadR